MNKALLLLASVFALSQGCFLAHGLDGDDEPAPPTPTPVPEPVPDPFPPVCDVSDTRIEVRIEDMGGGAACAYGDASGHVTSVQPAPEVGGIRVSIIRGFDSFSVCDYVVSNVGVDLAEQLSPTSIGVQGFASESSLVLVPPTGCDACDGCSCILSLPWLIAHDGPFPEDGEIGQTVDVFYESGPACDSPEALTCGYGPIEVAAEAYLIDIGGFDTAPILLGHIATSEGNTVGFERTNLSLRVLRANAPCMEAVELDAAWVLFGSWDVAFDAEDGTIDR